jgi:hypothetical protein
VTSPIERMIDTQANLRCTLCNAPAGTCCCWDQCPDCLWFFEVGGECHNPAHSDHQWYWLNNMVDGRREARCDACMRTVALFAGVERPPAHIDGYGAPE